MKSTTIQLSSDLEEQVEVFATRSERSKSAVIRIAVRQFLEKVKDGKESDPIN